MAGIRKRLLPYFEAMEQMLGERGEKLRATRIARHFRLEVEIDGVTFMTVVPGSPSDHRTFLNWRSQTRRRLADLGVLAQA